MSYTIRRANIRDLPRLQRLFYNTITSVGLKVYTKVQIKKWTQHFSDTAYWEHKFVHNNFYVATLNGEVVGFISLSDTGYIDYIYVSHNYQGKGIANLLYTRIEVLAKELDFKELTSDISALEKPFFEKKGFEILKECHRRIDNETLVNFSVKKVLNRMA